MRDRGITWNTQFDTGIPLGMLGTVIVVTEDREMEAWATQFGVQHDPIGVEAVRIPGVNHTCANRDGSPCLDCLRGDPCLGERRRVATGGSGDLATFLSLSRKGRAVILGLSSKPIGGRTVLALTHPRAGYTVLEALGGHTIDAASAVPAYLATTITVMARGDTQDNEQSLQLGVKPTRKRRSRERHPDEMSLGTRLVIALLVVGVLAFYGAIIWNCPWWWSN